MELITTSNKKRSNKYTHRCCLQLLMIFVTGLAATMAKAQSDRLNIRQAIDVALANNYGLHADSLNMSVTDFKNKQVTGLYLPQVSLSSKLNYNPAIASQMLPGAIAGQPDKDVIPVQFGTKYDAGTGVEVTQNIYRKDLLLQMRSAGLNNAIARTKYNLTKEDLIYQVAAAFYALQSSAQLIRTTTTDYQNLKNVLAIAKAQYDNGVLKRIEYETLEINVANKQSQLDQLKTQYSGQLNYFKYMLGIPADAKLDITDSIAPMTGMAMLDENQLMQRDDIHLYGQLIQSKEVEMKTINAEKLPALSTYFRYGYQSQFNSAGKAFDNDYWYNTSTVGLSLNVSLFDGNRRKNRTHVAETELQQLKWQKEQKQQQAQTELLTATQTLNNNQEQYRLNLRNLTLAEKVFASRSALYTEGVTTLAELLDAESELTEARNNYIQSMIGVQTGILDVHKANGTLLTGFLNTL